MVLRVISLYVYYMIIFMYLMFLWLLSGLRDGLTDISMDTIQTESESSILSDRSKDSGHIQPLKPVLLTPDAFTSPRYVTKKSLSSFQKILATFSL